MSSSSDTSLTGPHTSRQVSEGEVQSRDRSGQVAKDADRSRLKEVKLAKGPEDPDERKRLVKETSIQTLNAARKLAVQKRKETAAVRHKENELRKREKEISEIEKMSELTMREKELKKRQKALKKRQETSSDSSCSSDDEDAERKIEKKAARQVTAEKEHLVQSIYRRKIDEMRAEMLRKHFFSGS
jgi:hypothetical protein